jgi:dipeptidyl aminopeptidase/acylaminoacyl peptidase
MTGSQRGSNARWGAVTLLGLVLWSRAGQAQNSAPLPIEVLLAAPRLSPVTVPTFAPDGEWLAYTVVDHGRKAKFDPMSVPWYAVGGDIWISRISGNDARSLTLGHGNSWAPSWSPDGRRIAFLSDRGSSAADGQAHIWIWDRASDRLRQASPMPALDPWGRLGRLEWLPDNRTIVVKTLPEGQSSQRHKLLLSGVSDDEPVKPDTGVTARVFRSDPADSEAAPRTDPTDLNDFLGDLALVDVETGRARRLSGALRICSYALSPSRRMLAWAAAKRFERPGSYQILIDLFVYDLEKGQLRQLAADAPLGYGYVSAPVFSWSPTSRAIAYRTDGPPGTQDEVYVVSVDGGAPHRVSYGPVPADSPLYEVRPLWDGGTAVLFVRAGALWRARADGDQAVRFARAPDRWLRMIEHGYGTLWSPDGGRSTVVVTGNPSTKRMGLARVDLRTGAVTQLLEEDRWYDTTRAGPPVVTPDKSAIVYVAQDRRRPPDLWVAQGQGDPHPRQVSRVAPALSAFAGGDAEIIEWRGLDGDTLRGALLYPVGYRAGIRYPLIVKVYGPEQMLSDEINQFGLAGPPVENLQIFASRGYAVLLADSKLHVGTPLLDFLKAVMPGVDRAVELGVADPARIGVIGHSYGGYGALALLTHSRRFKAGVVRAGIGDLIAAYGGLSPTGTNYLLPWAEQGQGRMGGTPWEVRERYIENSPIFYLDRVEAPVLLIHGAADLGVPPFLADQVFSGLRRLGKRVEYARYVGESHSEEGWSLPNQIDYLNRVVAWFDRYLKAGETSPSPAAVTRDERPPTSVTPH